VGDKVITQSELKSELNYNPKTGKFYWIKPGKGRRKNGVAGGLNNGYICISWKGKKYQAHRLAWLYIHGYLPENDIDHINRDRTDNRLTNIREASRSCNLRNRGNFKNNKSGVKGVFYNQYSSFEVMIKINGKKINIGSFGDLTEAVCHRLAAEQAEDWAGCDSSSPAYKYVRKYIQEVS